MSVVSADMAQGSEALPVRRNKIKINKIQIRNKGINKTTVSAPAILGENKDVLNTR